MLDQAIEILRNNRLAALATVDPEGWPHCTMVGFAEDGVKLFFAIARESQKFRDIARDERISIAIGRDVINPASIRALAIKARARIVEDEKERQRAIELLLAKRPALKLLEQPTTQHSAVMVAEPEEIRVLDYSKGYGHSVLLEFGPEGQIIKSEDQVHRWGYGSDFRSVD